MTPFTTTDDGVVLPSDIAMAAWLGSLTTSDVLTDRAHQLTPAEIALMAFGRGAAA